MSRTTFSIILVLIGFAVYYFFLTDQWQALKEVRSDVAAANLALAELKDISQKADSLRETYNSVRQEDKEKISRMIPTGSDTANAVTDLEQTTARNGMILRSVDFALPAAGKQATGAGKEFNLQSGLYILPVSFEVIGRYDSFRRFLADLELNQRVLDVQTVNFGSAVADAYTFQLRAKAYYQ